MRQKIEERKRRSRKLIENNRQHRKARAARTSHGGRQRSKREESKNA